MGDVVDVEEDDMGDAWCVAPTEACSFVALAVFPNKEDAERYVALLRYGPQEVQHVRRPGHTARTSAHPLRQLLRREGRACGPREGDALMATRCMSAVPKGEQ